LSGREGGNKNKENVRSIQSKNFHADQERKDKEKKKKEKRE